MGGGAGAQGQGMGLRKGALAGQRGHDRGLRPFGELDQRVRSLGVEDALAGADDRTFRLEQGRHEISHILGRRAAPEGLHRRVFESVVRYLLFADVSGDFQHDRTGLALLQQAVRPSHHLRYPGRRIDVRYPLGDAPVVLHRFEGQTGAGAGPRRSARQQEDGHGVRVSLRHAAEGVFRAGPHLHHEDPDGIPVPNPAESIGDIDARPLLAAEYGTQALDRAGVDERVVRKATEPVQPLGLQDLRNGFVSGHLDTFTLLRAAGTTVSARRRRLSAGDRHRAVRGRPAGLQ